MVHEHMASNSPILIILFVIITFYEAKLVILYLILFPVSFLTLELTISICFNLLAPLKAVFPLCRPFYKAWDKVIPLSPSVGDS